MTAPTAPDNEIPELDDDLVPPAAPAQPAAAADPTTKTPSTKRPPVAPLKLGPIVLAAVLLAAIVVAVVYRLLGPLWGSVVLAGLVLLTAFGVWLWKRRAAARVRRGNGTGQGGPLARLRNLLPGGGRRGGRGGGDGAGGGSGKKKGGPLAALRRALGGGKNGGAGGPGSGKRGGPLARLRRALGGGGPGGGRGSGGRGRGGRERNSSGSGGRGGGSGRSKAPWWWPFDGGSNSKKKDKKDKKKSDGSLVETGPCGGPGPNDSKNKKKDKPKDKTPTGKPDGKQGSGDPPASRPPRPNRPTAPARTRSRGGSMGSRLDEAGLLRFGDSLKEDPDKIGAIGDFYRSKAAAADDNPINPGVTDDLHAIANLMNRAKEIAAGLHEKYTKGNDADINRNENPRRGEEKADHSYNNRDR
jgi:hypothetical protein